jgi:hypothetical protein
LAKILGKNEVYGPQFNDGPLKCAVAALAIIA